MQGADDVGGAPLGPHMVLPMEFSLSFTAKTVLHLSLTPIPIPFLRFSGFGQCSLSFSFYASLSFSPQPTFPRPSLPPTPSPGGVLV